METDPSAMGQLRLAAIPPHPPAMTAVPKFSKEDEKMIAFYQQAISFGLVCTPLKDLKGEVSRQVTSRMVKRDGEQFLWQTASPVLRLFPVEGCDLFPPSLLTKDSARHKKWTATSKEDLLLLFQPLLAESSSCCAGLSKAFKTASERVIRVVATIMPPATVEWTRTASTTTGSMSGTFWYILFDEAGEMHPPKTMSSDGGRADVALTTLLEAQMREQVYADLTAMADRGDPLSPGFLRQLGLVEAADILQARLLNEATAMQARLLDKATATQEATGSSSASDEAKTEVAKRLKGSFDIESIMDERPGTRMMEPTFLVLWSHAAYHTSWEVYRTEGEGVGQPMSTWEPLSSVRGTEAYALWIEQTVG